MICKYLGCSSLTSVNIPNSVTSIGGGAFRDCSGLTSINIPNSVTSIGNGAFSHCSGLTSVTIPNSVTSINENAFGECSGLTTLELGENVKEIGNYTFSGTDNLTRITCRRLRPASMGERVFANATYTKATLCVPSGSLSLYYSAPEWMKFDNIVESGSGGTPTLKGDMNDDGMIDVDDVNALINIILAQ